MRSDEDVLSWLVTPPNIQALDAGQRGALEADVQRLASDLRIIRSRLSAAAPTSSEIDGLTRGVIMHLGDFAKRLVSRDKIDVLKSWWDLQMAVESVLKGLLLQKTGQFPMVHTLSDLLSPARDVGLAFNDQRFDTWPGRMEMSDLRYGRGTRAMTSETYQAYRVALDLCRETAQLYDRKTDAGKASYLIQAVPWMRRSESEPKRDVAPAQLD